MTTERELDVVVHGATGFVGRLTAEYLAEHAPAGVRIGLSGRSLLRLEAVRDGLGPGAAGWPLLVTDSADDAQVAALAARTRVVATTVGPYLRHGLPLVGACARAGTHYADLTGEVLFVREAADRHHDEAVARDTRIVVSCGFDSVPSDLGVLVAAEQARHDGAGELTDTTLVVASARGGVSGGTVDTLRMTVAEAAKGGRARRLLADPYALSPDRAKEPRPGDGRDGPGIGHDTELGGWTGPFVMASYNTRVVRRSNALQDWAYGRGFRYREVMRVGRGRLAPLVAVGTAGALAAGAAGLAFPPTRALLDRVLPKPGEGPDEETRRTGRFRMEVHTTTTTGARYVAVVAAQGDPGYAATSVMLGESALALALDSDRLPPASGVLTPATALGQVLVERLRAAGFAITV
ncbi:MAG TPA: saccharopine dehydrogenase NADP-binding domain-containing protein, partial [Jiangellales bacterium]|nr:saccharopine dehydrogenase NADP-binding domain-containing protein [Jiangellales bacterium]